MRLSEKPILRPNERAIDRIIRSAVGTILLTFAFISLGGPVDLVGGTIALALGVVGAISLGTGLLGWCPFYAILGIRTCS